MAGEQAQVQGLDEFKRAAAAIPAALRKRVLRNALAAGARLVRDEARRNAPVLSLGNQMKAPYRKSGTVRDAIRVRTSKADRQAGDVGVFVNVRPLPGNKWKRSSYKSLLGVTRTKWLLVKKTERGAKNPNDPFYWRWLEFGSKFMAARPFLKPAAGRLSEALGVFENQLAKWVKSVDDKGPIA